MCRPAPTGHSGWARHTETSNGASGHFSCTILDPPTGFRGSPSANFPFILLAWDTQELLLPAAKFCAGPKPELSSPGSIKNLSIFRGMVHSIVSIFV